MEEQGERNAIRGLRRQADLARDEALLQGDQSPSGKRMRGVATSLEADACDREGILNKAEGD